MHFNFTVWTWAIPKALIEGVLYICRTIDTSYFNSFENTILLSRVKSGTHLKTQYWFVETQEYYCRPTLEGESSGRLSSRPNIPPRSAPSTPPHIVKHFRSPSWVSSVHTTIWTRNFIYDWFFKRNWLLTRFIKWSTEC